MTAKERKHTAPPRYDEAFKAGAVRMVTEQGRPSREVAKELGISSDRGVQYAAAAYRQRLADLGIRQSMSRKGDPYDNAVAENFFSCLKCERIHLHSYPSRDAAMAGIFSYIEAFYNPVHPHSAIGWRAPDDFASSLSAHHAA